MKTRMRWLLAMVTVLDIVFVFSFVGGGNSVSMAQNRGMEPSANVLAPSAAPGSEEQVPAFDLDTLKLLGEQLVLRKNELQMREEEANEILRGAEVLARAGIVTPDQSTVEQAPASLKPRKLSEDFLRLQRAYENMEPDSAAMAMIELAGRDLEVVVELLLGWKPRTSGAILDAITVRNAKLAADLSFEIWKRRGDNESVAAN